MISLDLVLRSQMSEHNMVSLDLVLHGQGQYALETFKVKVRRHNPCVISCHFQTRAPQHILSIAPESH